MDYYRRLSLAAFMSLAISVTPAFSQDADDDDDDDDGRPGARPAAVPQNGPADPAAPVPDNGLFQGKARPKVEVQ